MEATLWGLNESAVGARWHACSCTWWGEKNGDGHTELMRRRWRRCLVGEGEGKEEAVDVYVWWWQWVGRGWRRVGLRLVDCLWNENGSLAESRTLGRWAGSMFLIYRLKACQGGGGVAGVTIGRKGLVGRWWGEGRGGKLSIRVAVRGSRIRGIAPQVLTARMQNQSAKAAGEGQFSWIRATGAKHFG